tara:strand:- start:7636 stop:8790 length:1155 start_codon:yes stop_codon:yes gene_type:complete
VKQHDNCGAKIMDTSIVGSTHRPVSIGVQLGEVDKLYYLARDKKPESRAILTHEIGAILEADVTPRESEMVADVLIELLRQAESDLRQALSEKLAVIDKVPLRLVLQLANDEINIARPVLQHSEVLGEFDLMYIIKSRTPEYWQTIAMRKNLSDQVIDVLADTQDFETALALAENTEIMLTQHAMTALSDIARESDVLAMPLLRRSEVPSDLAMALYKYVGEEIKNFISTNYDLDIGTVSSAVDKTVEDFTDWSVPEECMPEAHLMEAAKAAKSRDMLTVQGMLTTLRRGNLCSFVAQLSVFTDVPAEMIVRILMQKNGQGLAIISKAFGFEKQDFVSIFMLTSKFWNQGRMIEPSEIKSAMEYYNKATQELAMEIIKGKLAKS